MNKIDRVGVYDLMYVKCLNILVHDKFSINAQINIKNGTRRY